MRHVPVCLARVLGQRKSKCQMNDRVERTEGKQSHLPRSSTCGARARRRPCTHPGFCRRRRGRGAGGRPRCRPDRSPCALRPVHSHRGESWWPGVPLRVACSSGLQRPLPKSQGTVRCGPDPATRSSEERRRRSRARPARPSAALPAALRSGLGLRSPLCWHLASFPTTPALSGLLRAAAHPRVTPRPLHDPRIVSTQQQRRGRAKPRLPPAHGRAPGVEGPGAARFTAELGGLAQRVPERPRSARLAAAGSPGVSHERRAARLRLPQSPLPAGSPGLPPAATFPQSGGRTPAPTPAPPPSKGEESGSLTSSGAGAPPARRLGCIGQHLPAGRLAGGFLHVGDRGRGKRGRERTERLPDLGQQDLPEEGEGERGGAEDESRGCRGSGAALLRCPKDRRILKGAGGGGRRTSEVVHPALFLNRPKS